MIPGVETYHPRITWQDPRWPVIGPVDDWTNNTTAVIHYTAADDLIDGDPGEYAHMLPQYLRNMQYSYAKPKSQGGRGYSVGYLFAVDWLGGVWQLRGWEFQSAANVNHNSYTVPILMLVDGDDGATEEALAAARAIIREAGFRAGGRRLAVVGHGDIGSTSCPGAGLRRQLRAGQFDPYAVTPPQPVVPPVVVPDLEDEEIMVALIIVPPADAGPNPPWLVHINGSTTYIGSAAYSQLVAKGVPVVQHNLDQYSNYRKAAGL